MTDKPNPDQQSPWRLFGTGLELAGAVLILAFIGHLVDQKIGSEPWGLLTGAVLGLIGSMYNLIKALNKANRDANQSDHDDR